MTREDMLRELELLPVWQLRTPTLVPVEADLAASATDEPTVLDAPVVDEPAHIFRYIVSGDAHWGFVLPQSQTEEAEALLQNMLKAVSVHNVAQNIKDASHNHLSQYPTKVIVAMGEQEAQALLGVKETLAQLRGEAHKLKTSAVIATFTADHLLLNVQDKVKAWEDLCLAKFTIANL